MTIAQSKQLKSSRPEKRSGLFGSSRLPSPARYVLSILSIIVAILTSSPVQPQVLGQRFQSLETSYPAAGVELGQGWDSAIGQQVSTHCLSFATEEAVHASSRLEVHELKDTSSLFEARQITASASGTVYGVTAEASFVRTTQRALNTDYLNYLASYTFHMKGDFVVADRTVPHGNAAEPQRIAAVVLSKAVRNAFQPHDGERSERIAKFEGTCGDYFVSAIHYGVRVNILATYASTNRKEKEAVKAAVKAKGFDAAISVATSKDKTLSYETAKFHFIVDQQGSKKGLAPNVSEFSEVKRIIEEFSSEDELSDAGAYLITLTPYRVLADWRELFGPKADEDLRESVGSPTLRDIGLLYNAYTDLYVMLNDVEEEFLRQQFRRRNIRPGDPGRTVKYAMGVMKMFGGVEDIRKNQTNVRRHLRVMERLFDHCFQQRACRGAIETAKLASLRESMTNGTNDGSGGEDSESREVTALLRELGKPMKEFVGKRVREFYEVLAAVPLHAEAFQIKRISDWVEHGGIEDVTERVRAMRMMINDLIYYEREELERPFLR